MRPDPNPHQYSQTHVRLNGRGSGSAEHSHSELAAASPPRLDERRQTASEASHSPGPESSRCWRGRGFPGGWVDSGSGRNAEWDENTGE